MEEIWKNIEGYEGLYQVSNLGRVKSLNYHRSKKPGIMSPTINGGGYRYVRLSGEQFRVNQIVAKTFIPNPNNYPQVNHINEIKDDDRVDNLEWCTAKYNNNFGTRKLRSSLSQINQPSKSKSVLQYDLNGNFIKEYPSIMEAHRETGISVGNISECCNEKRKTAGGFIWRYK